MSAGDFRVTLRGTGTTIQEATPKGKSADTREGRPALGDHPQSRESG
jgi:hypothetical protein